MNIKIGKLYRTRSGHKVEITGVDPTVPGLFTGCIYYYNGQLRCTEPWTGERWHTNGSWSIVGATLLDLVCLWVDNPRLTGWACIRTEGQHLGTLYWTKGQAMEYRAQELDGHQKIKIVKMREVRFKKKDKK